MFRNIDLRQVWTLTRYTLKSEWRTSSLRAIGKRRKQSSWWAFWSLVSYIFIGLLLIGFFQKNLDGEAFITASAVLMLYVGLITASNIFLSFGTGFLSPEEAQIIAPMPVSSESFFFSRLTVLLCYSTVISVAVAIAPAVALSFVIASSPITGIMLLVAAVLCSITASMVIIVLYGIVMSKMSRQRMIKLTGYVQFIGTLITTGSFIILPRLEHGFDFHPWTLSNHTYFSWLPPFWFGSLAGLPVVRTHTTGTLALAALGLLALLSATSHVLLAKNYQQDVSDLTASSVALTKRIKHKKEPALFRGFSKLLGTHEARAVLMLFRAQFRYDAKFRMSLIATLPITLIYFVVAIITGGVADPFVSSIKEAINTQGVYMIALFMPLLLMQSISQSDNYKASWIFYSSPLDRSKLLLAVRNTLYAWVIGPFLVILAVLFSFFMPIHHAVPHVMVLGAMSTFIFQTMLMLSPKMPFAQRRRPNRGNVAVMFGAMLLGGVAMVALGFEMVYAYRTPTRFWTSFALILTLSILMELAVRARLRNKLEQEEFEG